MFLFKFFSQKETLPLIPCDIFENIIPFLFRDDCIRTVISVSLTCKRNLEIVQRFLRGKGEEIFKKFEKRPLLFYSSAQKTRIIEEGIFKASICANMIEKGYSVNFEELYFLNCNPGLLPEVSPMESFDPFERFVIEPFKILNYLNKNLGEERRDSYFREFRTYLILRNLVHELEKPEEVVVDISINLQILGTETEIIEKSVSKTNFMPYKRFFLKYSKTCVYVSLLDIVRFFNNDKEKEFVEKKEKFLKDKMKHKYLPDFHPLGEYSIQKKMAHVKKGFHCFIEETKNVSDIKSFSYNFSFPFQ